MAAIITHISDYFEQFNSSSTTNFRTSHESHADSSTSRIPLTYYVFDFELYSYQAGPFRDLRFYMMQYWHSCFYFALAYIILIFGGQKYMKDKPKYDLRLWLVAWNILLALFSIFGAVRVLPELIYALYRHGIHYSVCNDSNAFGVIGFWTWAFCFSKLPELVDTLFIVLRKQPLIFLHWYHHASVLIYCWFSYHNYTSTGRWFCGLNYVVHGVMYSYYAFRALKFRIPRWISMFVTILQINQMVIGCWVNVKAWEYTNIDKSCNVTKENIKVSLAMYATYFLLFAHFFCNAYIFKSKHGRRQNDKKQQTEDESSRCAKKFD